MTSSSDFPPLSFESYAGWPHLPMMFFSNAARYGGKPFLWQKQRGSYRCINWENTAYETAGLALGLRELGIEQGDRVILAAANSPQWLMADLAIMSVGAITVPAYVTNTVADYRHLLKDSGAKAAFVSTPSLASRLMEAAKDAPSLKTVIGIECLPVSLCEDRIQTKRWPGVLADCPDPVGEIAPLLASLKREDTACIIYTSGTGGTPKGVMLSHGAILHNCAGGFALLSELGLDDEVFLSFLPLSHAYEHTAGQFFPISIGAQIYYAEGLEKLASNMMEARPTLMTAVPRLYETLHARFTQTIERQGGIKAALFRQALHLGRKKSLDRKGLSLPQKGLDFLLDILIRRKVAARFGGRLKALVSGGAPLNPEIGLFFQSLGLRILQGYGQTECGPVASCNPPHRVKIETVGPPLRQSEVRIADDGEILVRGEHLMQGYWGNPKASAEALQGGWLHTGDIGTIDEEGYIRITDRKKDILVNAGGDNIAPQKIETFLTLRPEIAQAMVYGDRKPYLSAVLCLDPAFMETWCDQNNGTDPGKKATQAALKRHLKAVIETVNGELSSIEKIRRFIIADEAFTIENGFMTPTLKIRRHKIAQHYREHLEALYSRQADNQSPSQ